MVLGIYILDGDTMAELTPLSAGILGATIMFALIAITWVAYDWVTRRMDRKEREIKRWVRENYEHK